MALDFQQVREQIKKLGETTYQRAEQLFSLRAQAAALLISNSTNLEHLRLKMFKAVEYDPYLRCAAPVREYLDACFHLPHLPEQATILAADGSQIAPDRHAGVNFGLINVGAIQMDHGKEQAPVTQVSSKLLYDEDLYGLTEAVLALRRDLNERTMLAELAIQASAPVITFTDGPMELWGAKDSESSEFKKSLDAYIQVLSQLKALKVTTAGYVDKPASNLVVRLLEVAKLEDGKLKDIRNLHPLRGVTDIDLFKDLLAPGERSAVFAIQSNSAINYKNNLALHFFYLNVGRAERPWLARVEIPAWVAQDEIMLEHLHAILVHQCLIMGSRPYPYLLHRAHEVAIVTRQEKDQVAQMLAGELRERGVSVGEISHKQSAKNLPPRTSY